jgi:hypothetical protein
MPVVVVSQATSSAISSFVGRSLAVTHVSSWCVVSYQLAHSPSRAMPQLVPASTASSFVVEGVELPTCEISTYGWENA